MNMIIKSLTVKCKKKNIEVPFSRGITYIYGKMGAGKSTIVRLIAFCFGQELIDTPALQHEFIGASLRIELGKYEVFLHRDKTNNNEVCVEWTNKEKNIENRVYVPITNTTGESILPNENVENLSDLLFYLSGVTPPKVRRSKVNEESELIRLSFRNIMKFWYLDQDHIDSSFFNLEEKSGFKRNASRDVMRMVLGFYYENIALLESELSIIKAQRANKEGVITHLKSFLKENEIEDVAIIDNKIEKLNQDLLEIKNNRKNALERIERPNKHVVDDIRSSLRSLISNISEIESALLDISKQIESRKRLKEEFFVASIKMNNLVTAKKILNDAEFECCPKCGTSIEIKEEMFDVCTLCNQKIDIDKSEEFAIVETDLKNRRNEIEVSISKLEKQKLILQKELKELLNVKFNPDLELETLEKEYDSIYLARIKKYDQEIEKIKSNNEYWNKIKKLSLKIIVLQNEVDTLKNQEKNKKDELDEELKKSSQQKNKFEELKKYFIKALNSVKFPGIKLTDIVMMNTKEFYPNIISKDN